MARHFIAGHDTYRRMRHRVRSTGFDNPTPRLTCFPDFDRDWPRLVAKALVVESGCWEWQAYSDKKGYGQIGVRLKSGKDVNRGAHRVAYTLFHGLPDFPAEFVLHKCDNPKCINPEHLFLGNNQDNVTDMLNKGRARPPRGESHPSAVLTEAVVVGIRKRRLAGAKTVDLAAEFGVNPGTISNACTGATWAHAAGPTIPSTRPQARRR